MSQAKLKAQYGHLGIMKQPDIELSLITGNDNYVITHHDSCNLAQSFCSFNATKDGSSLYVILRGFDRVERTKLGWIAKLSFINNKLETTARQMYHEFMEWGAIYTNLDTLMNGDAAHFHSLLNSSLFNFDHEASKSWKMETIDFVKSCRELHMLAVNTMVFKTRAKDVKKRIMANAIFCFYGEGMVEILLYIDNRIKKKNSASSIKGIVFEGEEMNFFQSSLAQKPPKRFKKQQDCVKENKKIRNKKMKRHAHWHPGKRITSRSNNLKTTSQTEKKHDGTHKKEHDGTQIGEYQVPIVPRDESSSSLSNFSTAEASMLENFNDMLFASEQLDNDLDTERAFLAMQ
jgi:hypothetical protein